MGGALIRPAVVEVPLTPEMKQRLVLLGTTAQSPGIIFDAIMSGNVLDPVHLDRAMEMRAERR